MSSVALLSPCYWPEVRRGGERFTRELADGLIRRGLAPTLITSHPGLPSRRREAGLDVLRLWRPPQRALLRRGYEQYLTHVPFSYLALGAGDYALAHAMYPTDALAAARWRAKTGRPALLSYLGIPDRAGLDERRGHRRILARALAHSDRVVALSQYAASAFADSFGYDAPVIAPGVNLDLFTPARDRSERPTIVCTADASEPRKHVGLLIDAFALVRAELPDAQLVLSGPKRFPDAAGVKWLNLDDPLSLVLHLQRAWVSVLASESEAFGLVLIEALACGTPVVGYRDGAIPEVIDSAAIGRLFDELTPRALAAELLAVLALVEHPGTVDACRARAEQFSSARCSDRYIELYRELGVAP